MMESGGVSIVRASNVPDGIVENRHGNAVSTRGVDSARVAVRFIDNAVGRKEAEDEDVIIDVDA
jgi:hypothetical protein